MAAEHIIMWSGSIASIPSGWVLCDGTNGTQDLRDKFIVGAQEDDGGVAKTNLTGSLTQSGNSNMAAHTHYITFPLYQGADADNGHVGCGNNSFQASFNSTLTSAGTGSDVYPRYYALAYIMKT